MAEQVNCVKNTKFTRMGVRRWYYDPSCANTDKTLGLRLSRVKSVTTRKILDEKRGKWKWYAIINIIGL